MTMVKRKASLMPSLKIGLGFVAGFLFGVILWVGAYFNSNIGGDSFNTLPDGVWVNSETGERVKLPTQDVIRPAGRGGCSLHVWADSEGNIWHTNVDGSGTDGIIGYTIDACDACMRRHHSVDWKLQNNLKAKGWVSNDDG